MRLWGSVDDGPDELMGIGHKQMLREQGVVYPAWRFDNVLVSAARSGKAIKLSASVDGARVEPEYWSYGGHPAEPEKPEAEQPPAQPTDGAAEGEKTEPAAPEQRQPIRPQPAPPPPVSCQ